MTRLLQPKCLELGLGGKSEDPLEKLARLISLQGRHAPGSRC